VFMYPYLSNLKEQKPVAQKYVVDSMITFASLVFGIILGWFGRDWGHAFRNKAFDVLTDIANSKQLLPDQASRNELHRTISQERPRIRHDWPVFCNSIESMLIPTLPDRTNDNPTPHEPTSPTSPDNTAVNRSGESGGN